MFLHCVVNRYVDNICKNPTEEKYRKIKLSNKVFQVCTKLAFLSITVQLLHFSFLAQY